MFKKVFLAVLAIVGSISIANAQEVFHKGTTAINAGVGLGSYYPSLSIPPLSVSLDYGVTDNLINGNNGSISVGGFVGYASGSYSGWIADKVTVSYAVLGARGAFHYQFAPKLDTYAGMMISYNIHSSNYDGYSNFMKGSHVDWSIFLGGRYFFTEKVGAFAELGYGFYNLNLGVTFKL